MHSSCGSLLMSYAACCQCVIVPYMVVNHSFSILPCYAGYNGRYPLTSFHTWNTILALWFISMHFCCVPQLWIFFLFPKNVCWFEPLPWTLIFLSLSLIFMCYILILNSLRWLVRIVLLFILGIPRPIQGEWILDVKGLCFSSCRMPRTSH